MYIWIVFRIVTLRGSCYNAEIALFTLELLQYIPWAG